MFYQMLVWHHWQTTAIHRLIGSMCSIDIIHSSQHLKSKKQENSFCFVQQFKCSNNYYYYLSHYFHLVSK